MIQDEASKIFSQHMFAYQPKISVIESKIDNALQLKFEELEIKIK
jgi:hypothetical protein